MKFVSKTSSLLRWTLFTGALFLFSPPTQAFDLTVAKQDGCNLVNYTFTWTAVTKSTDEAQISYCIFENFGSTNTIDTTTPVGSSLGTFRKCVLDINTAIIPDGHGTRSFTVVSSDSVSGAVEISNEVTIDFVHSVERTDGDGTHRGVDQQWDFTYKMHCDAYATFEVFPPGTTFSSQVHGFSTGPAVATVNPTKTIINNIPRSGELANGSITNTERWDSRSSTGVVVSNGIYYLLIQADLDPGQGFYSENEQRYGAAFTIPVDILRIMNLSATGITLSNPTANITYDITGDANVRVIIASPGSTFTVDGNGNIQATNSSGTIDPDLIVSSFTFQRKAGSNTEVWDGTSSTGTVMASGVYGVGISASDEYGNTAISASGNDFPIFTTITLERTAGSNAGTTGSTADTTPPTLTSLSLSTSSVINTAVSTLTIVLADADSTLNLAGTAITVRDPNNSAVTTTITNDGSDTITVIFPTALETNGTYALRIDAVDTAGNSVTFNLSFAINIRLEESQFEGAMVLFPNPAVNTTATVQYDLNVDASVELDIFNILGERVYHDHFSDTRGTAKTRTWGLVNQSGKRVGSGLYLIRLKAIGSGSEVVATKKLVVVQ